MRILTILNQFCRKETPFENNFKAGEILEKSSWAKFRIAMFTDLRIGECVNMPYLSLYNSLCGIWQCYSQLLTLQVKFREDVIRQLFL